MGHPASDDGNRHGDPPTTDPGGLSIGAASSITDNGPQYIAEDFKEFIRVCRMTHVQTSPYYHQSDGNSESWHQSLKEESIQPAGPLSLTNANRLVGAYVAHSNTQQEHSAICHMTPLVKRECWEAAIFADKVRKLALARQQPHASLDTASVTGIA